MRKVSILLFLIMLAGVTGCKQEKKDPVLEKVDHAIAMFLENHASSYLKEDSIDFYVASAIKALEKHDDVSLSDFVSAKDVESYYENYNYQSPSDIFKAIVICKAFDVSYEKAKNELAKIEAFDIYNYTYGLIALRIADINKQLQEDLASKILIIREEDYRDADYAGFALIATAGLDLDRSPLFSLIDDNVSADGVIAWGNPNSCSTASVILGLIANDIDPTSSKYTVDENNLITSLLKYHQNGAFKYLLDGDFDFGFATPQAFAALVAYKIYYTTKEPVNLFL